MRQRLFLVVLHLFVDVSSLVLHQFVEVLRLFVVVFCLILFFCVSSGLFGVVVVSCLFGSLWSFDVFLFGDFVSVTSQQEM